MSFEEWMPASWYIKHGYTEVDRDGMKILVWKTFNDGWCQDSNSESDLTRKIVKEYGDRVIYKEYDTSDRDILREWGIDNAILVDNEWLTFGPHSVEEKLRKLIQEKIKNL